MTQVQSPDRRESSRYAQWSEEAALELISALAAMRGPLLPILHALEDTFGYIDPSAVGLIATALNLSRADVYGVVTFYSDLRSSPPGEVSVQICRGEACQSVGAHALAEHAVNSIGVGFGETSADGSVTLDEVFCLGNCALGPTVCVDGRLHGRVQVAEFDRLIGDCASKRETA